MIKLAKVLSTAFLISIILIIIGRSPPLKAQNQNFVPAAIYLAQIPIDSRSNDLWFQHIAIVVRDMEQAYQKLREFDVTYISTALQKPPEYIEAAAGIEAFYFYDPDDDTLELIHFSPDKSDPRWQKPTEQVFLGIDHTAIAINF